MGGWAAGRGLHVLVEKDQGGGESAKEQEIGIRFFVCAVSFSY